VFGALIGTTYPDFDNLWDCHDVPVAIPGDDWLAVCRNYFVSGQGEKLVTNSSPNLGRSKKL
jgi:hypothetical protein